MWKFKKKKQRSSLGIDIGSKSIKAVELEKQKDRVVLKNYGGLKLSAGKTDSFQYFDKRTLLPFSKNVSLAIKAILEEAKIETKEVIFSLPDFTTFFTSFSLPKMTPEELKDAVQFEAKKHIPIPFNEVVLDWELIGDTVNEKEGENKVLVMAINKSLIAEYKKIAKECGLKLLSLEAEVMGLKRAVVSDSKENVCLVEIGSQSTTISIVSKGFLITSVSFDVAQKDYTYSISEALNIDLAETERIKMNIGLKSKNKKIEEAVSPILKIITGKIKQVINIFEIKEEKITKVILLGGAVNMLGLLEFFKENLNEFNVEKSNSFENIFYEPELKPLIPEISATFSIALGEALKRFKNQ